MPALKIPIVITVIACFTLGTFFSIPAADPMPESTTLLEKSSSYNTDQKLGKDFYPFLVDPDSNKDWWEWSFRQLTYAKSKDPGKVDSAFKKAELKVAYKAGDGSATAESLNRVCKHLYKDSSSSNVPESIWKYCSPLQGKPSTIKEALEKDKPHPYNNKLGKNQEESLIATSTNSTFWTLKNKWFDKQTINDDKFFKPFKDDNKKTLLDACEKAYKADGVESSTASEAKPKQDALTKYCGFKVS